MNFVVRTLLIWMLALAVPLQGMAAVTMASCETSKHSPVQTHQASSHGDDVRSGAAPASHHHHGAVTSALTADDHEPMSVEASKTASHKCSACAFCCSVGALPNTVLTVPAPEAMPTVFATLAPAIDAFAADGLERPPRRVRA